MSEIRHVLTAGVMEFGSMVMHLALPGIREWLMAKPPMSLDDPQDVLLR